GKGTGEGPGEEGGKGDGPYNGPSGGRLGRDARPVVDTRPVPLNEPRPNYTEEARRNKITGTVRARVLIGSDGLVKQVKIERGLPDGLNEQAIQAVYKVRFRPAMKSGQPVAWWVPFEIDFNLR